MKRVKITLPERKRGHATKLGHPGGKSNVRLIPVIDGQTYELEDIYADRLVEIGYGVIVGEVEEPADPDQADPDQADPDQSDPDQAEESV